MEGKPAAQVATLRYPAGMLHLEYTLTNGQMFRWKKLAEDWWTAASAGRVIRIRRIGGDDSGLDEFEFQTYPGEPDEQFVRDFLRLDVDLEPVYRAWLEADPYLGSLAERFAGLRIAKQD